MKDLFGLEEIRALSWKQPYASLMLHGKIETRRWATPYRGLVLICASLKEYTDEQLDLLAGDKQVSRIINTLSPIKIEETNGTAIGIGRLVDCRLMKKSDEDKCFVQYSPDLWCHIYQEVKAIEPFPWKGSQGWRKLTKEIRDQIIIIK